MTLVPSDHSQDGTKEQVTIPGLVLEQALTPQQTQDELPQLQASGLKS